MKKITVFFFVAVLLITNLCSCTSKSKTNDQIINMDESKMDESKIDKFEMKEFELEDLISDIYKTTEETKIESKYFDIVVDEGMVISEKCGDLLDTIAEYVMVITGLKFYIDNECKNKRITVHIQNEDGQYVADCNTIYLNESDAIATSGLSNRTIHEFSHCIQVRNYYLVNHILNEGFAQCCEEEYVKITKIPTVYYFMRTVANYQYPNNDAIIATLEKSLILNKPDPLVAVPFPIKDEYSLGKRLFQYINEKYGMDTIIKIYSKLHEEENVSGKSIVNTLYECTSENFFDDCRNWCNENSKIITTTVPALDYTNYSTVYPSYIKFRYLKDPSEYTETHTGVLKYYINPICGKIDDEIMLDYTYGHKFYELSENRECHENYKFSIYSDKPCTLTLYDENKNEIKSISVPAAETLNIKEKTFAYMKIEGKCTFTIKVAYKEILPEELLE